MTNPPPPPFWPGQIVRPRGYDPKQHDDAPGTIVEISHSITLNGEKQNVRVRWLSPCGQLGGDNDWYHPSELQPIPLRSSPPA